MTRSERDAILVGIRISARIWELRRLAMRTAEVFGNGERAGLAKADVASQMLGILDEQWERDRD
jgi:hypothetical protein